MIEKFNTERKKSQQKPQSKKKLKPKTQCTSHSSGKLQIEHTLIQIRMPRVLLLVIRLHRAFPNMTVILKLLDIPRVVRILRAV